MISRRTFLEVTASGTVGLTTRSASVVIGDDTASTNLVEIVDVKPNEGIVEYIVRSNGKFDDTIYKRILGAANEFKEGDEIVGIAAAEETSRRNARSLLANTRLRDIDQHPLLVDQLHALLRQSRDGRVATKSADWTVSEFKQYLLTEDEAAIKGVMPGLSSEVIGCVVKLMSNDELITVGAKVFNPLPGSQIGSRGYLGARVQPNSPTDNVDDIRWQVFDAWAYGVGDVLLGTNPVSSDPASVAAVERTLQDILVTFGVEDLLPHCVLSHIDVQAEVEKEQPGSTELWFQSIAGCDSANTTFDINVQKMLGYATSRTGPFGLYFETGQGADFTNGHAHGFDMVLHESRKYGFARALSQEVARARIRGIVPAAAKSGERDTPDGPWSHLNDVAGFIGPEVFRTREQLVRCCLEDIVMGKLHGLCLGLDVCSTLHMDVSLDDLDWCLDQIMPANPAYLMALPTKIDPMLGYLTTGYQDHVRLREKFGYRVNDRMWSFFQTLGVIDANGNPGKHFGDPAHVFLEYRREKGDSRPSTDVLDEARSQMVDVRRRGVFLVNGHGDRSFDLSPDIDRDIRRIYSDAKKSIRTELKPEFIATIPNVVRLQTRSTDRDDYILHPDSGERLSESSVTALRDLRDQHAGRHNVQIVISDGLNALAIMDYGHLAPFLRQIRAGLASDGFKTSPENLVVDSGRVRAGYRIGETLFANLSGCRAILHVIGERPGTGHHTFSVYITSPDGSVWTKPNTVDHNITKVVSGIATTALAPVKGADETVRILGTMA